MRALILNFFIEIQERSMTGFSGQWALAFGVLGNYLAVYLCIFFSFNILFFIVWVYEKLLPPSQLTWSWGVSVNFKCFYYITIDKELKYLTLALNIRTACMHAFIYLLSARKWEDVNACMDFLRTYIWLFCR